jgi:hypothetical protein
VTTVEQIVVLAKAIPASSLMHGEITCVAGIAEDDLWRRLHPVPTKFLSRSYFMKFGIIKVETDNWRGANPRPEDRWLVNYEGCVGKITDWEERRAFLRKHLDKSVNSILASGRSLGLIRPEIEDFYVDQNNRLRYKFRDAERLYDLACREWEALALAKKYPDMFEKVRAKFCNWMKTRDTYFVIGTTVGNVAKMVVAVHYPPKA